MHANRPEGGLSGEFDRQLENLVQKGYPRLLGLSEDALVESLMPLRARLRELSRPTDDKARISFVIVTGSRLVSPHAAMPLVTLRGRSGFTTMEVEDLERFTAIDGLEVPAGPAYLLADVETGVRTLDVPPDEAIRTIEAEGRSPLTIEEGVALTTHFPEALRTMSCFSMLGSRCGDRRVTAMWISAGRPRLGWCWAGAPHTWLGSASCASRLAPS